MNTPFAIAIVIIMAAIITLTYFLFSTMPKITLTTISSLQSNTSFITSSTHTSTISIVGSSSVYPNTVKNMTVTSGQVITALGTGWTAASQYNYGPSSITLPNSSIIKANGYGIANFSNRGTYLTIEWIGFKSRSAAVNYVNSESQYFPNATKNTSTSGNATYTFYAGYAIYQGQAASIIYAYDGSYGIYILNRGTTFPQQYAVRLLNYQLSDLNVT